MRLRPTRSRALIATALVLLGGIVLRILFLGQESFWYDEAITGLAMRMPFTEMVRDRFRAGHSPLYFGLLHLYAGLFGTSEVALRLPSALASSASLVALYLLARRVIADRSGAVLALAFFALSGLNLYYAQEARMYALCSLFLILSFFFLHRALAEGRGRDWVLYAACLVASFYASVAALPVLAAQLAYGLLRRRRIAAVLAGLAAAILLYMPMVLFYLRPGGQRPIAWVPPVAASSLMEIFYGFAFRPVPPERMFRLYATLAPGLEIASLALPAALLVHAIGRAIIAWKGVRQAANDPAVTDVALPMLWLALPLALEVLYSLLAHSVLGPKRYLLVLSPAYTLLLAIGVARLRPAAVRIGVGALVVLLFAVSAFSYYALPAREDWRGAIRHLDAELRPGEVLYGNLSTQTLYQYYGRHPELVVLDVEEAPSAPFAAGWVMLRDRDLRVAAPVVAWLQRSGTLDSISGFDRISLYRFRLSPAAPAARTR